VASDSHTVMRAFEDCISLPGDLTTRVTSDQAFARSEKVAGLVCALDGVDKGFIAPRIVGVIKAHLGVLRLVIGMLRSTSSFWENPRRTLSSGLTSLAEPPFMSASTWSGLKAPFRETSVAPRGSMPYSIAVQSASARPSDIASAASMSVLNDTLR